MSHIVESCPLTKLNGGLSQLHSADKDAVSWLTSYGSWTAYEKKKTERKQRRQTLVTVTVTSQKMAPLTAETTHFKDNCGGLSLEAVTQLTHAIINPSITPYGWHHFVFTMLLNERCHITHPSPCHITHPSPSYHPPFPLSTDLNDTLSAAHHHSGLRII